MSAQYLFVSCYSDRESQAGLARGIYVYAFDAERGELRFHGSEDDAYNPSYMALTRDGRFLYAADEVEGTGLIAAYSIDQASQQLTFLNRETYPGGALCSIHVGLNRRHVFAANYLGGNVLSVKALGDGGIGELLSNMQHTGSSVDPHRQQKSYAHCAMPDNDGRFLLACDLGTDRIYSYAIADSGQLSPAGEAAVPPGEGPRHLIFDRAGRRAFVITELNNSVISYDYDPQTGTLKQADLASALPDGTVGTFNGADIQLSPDESTLYASVRDISSHGADGIAAFKLDGTKLLRDGFIDTKKLPRSFAVSPDGRWLIAACQGSDAVQVIDARTRDVVSEVKLPLPVCVKFAVNG